MQSTYTLGGCLHSSQMRSRQYVKKQVTMIGSSSDMTNQSMEIVTTADEVRDSEKVQYKLF